MRAYALLLMSALGGCTTSLATRPMNPAAANGAIGMRYALPALQYATTATWRLSDCKGSTEGSTDPLRLEFDVTVDAKPEMVDGEWFAVDYRDLGSWSKTSSFDMETYENQTLKSFNAKADDQSGEIAAGALKAGFSIARLAGGLPAVPAIAGDDPPRLVCPTDKINMYRDLKAALEKSTKELTDLNAKLEPLVVQSLIGALTEQDKKDISDLRKLILAESKKITDTKTKMDEIGAVLSWIETFEYQPRWDSGAAGLDWQSSFPTEEAPKRKLQLKWAQRLFGPGAVDGDLTWVGGQMDQVAMVVRASTSSDAGAICDQAGVKRECVVPDTPRWNEFVSNTADARPRVVPGIAFRTPARGRLRICRKVSPAVCAVGTPKELLVSDTRASYPQLGRLGVLPFTNGLGQNNELSATFRADGSIERASYSEKRARGKVVVDVLNGGLDQALALDKSIRERRKAELEEAQGAAAAELDRQIAVATKEKSLLEVQRALDPANIAATDQLARTNAEIAQLTADKNLRELRAQVPEDGTQ